MRQKLKTAQPQRRLDLRLVISDAESALPVDVGNMS